MKSLAIILFLIPIITGCSMFGDRVRNTTQATEVSVPLLYCPAPPEFNRPSLPIHTLSASQLNNDGEVAKAYAASMLVLLGYVSELERSLDSYDATSKAYDELRKRYELRFNQTTPLEE